MKCECCGAISIDPVQLTQRETDVLVQLCKGSTTKEISKTLGIGLWTVNGHIKEAFRKLGVGSRGEAAVMACRMGLPV